jgi:hypothetical protein
MGNGMNGVGAGFGSQLLGMIGGHQAERRNYRNQRNLMHQQFSNQLGLNRQGHDLQMDMWNKTNYGAQVEHMKNAGLNPALMYKGAGAGGTTGSQTGGSASMGSSQQGKVMDMSNLMMGAQIEALKAKANLDNTHAQKAGGVDTKEAESRIDMNILRLEEIKTGIEGTKAKTLLDEYTGILRKIEGENAQEVISTDLRLAGEKIRELRLNNDITEETFQDQIKLMIEEVGLKIDLRAKTRKETGLIKLKGQTEGVIQEKFGKEMDEMASRISLNAVKEVNESRNATTAEKNLKVQEMLKKLEVEMNNLRVGAQKRGQVFNLIGNILNGIFGLASKAMPNKVMHVGQ